MKRALSIIARKPISLAGLVVFTAITLLSFAGPLVLPPAPRNIRDRNQPPSAAYVLGTDNQGKDNFVKLVHGGREVLITAFAAAALATATGITLGALSGLAGGRLDTVLMGLANIWLTVPSFPLLVILATIIQLNSPILLAAVIAFFGWAGLAREVRSQVLSLKRRDYIEAATLLDLGTPHIIFKEMLPSMMSFIAIGFVARITGAILSQTGLVFLGLVPFSEENWGVSYSLAYNRAAHYSYDSMWSLIAPTIAIVLLNLSLVALQQALDEVFNPRLRQI